MALFIFIREYEFIHEYGGSLVRILAAVQDIVEVSSNVEAVDQSWNSPWQKSIKSRIDIQISDKSKEEAAKDHTRKGAGFSKSQFDNNIVIYSDGCKVETGRTGARIFFTNMFERCE
jgi:hypothetical protein